MTDTFVTKDSGDRREFPTGSRRDVREGKGRFDLLPFHAIRRLAQLYERGARKYGDRNWEKGQPLSSYADSMLRHAFQAAAGYTDEDHFVAVAWNALAVIDHQERIRRGELPTELDDLPRPAFANADEVLDEEVKSTSFQDLRYYFPSVRFDFEGKVDPSFADLIGGPGNEQVSVSMEAQGTMSADTAAVIDDLVRRADRVETVNGSTHTARISISAGQE